MPSGKTDAAPSFVETANEIIRDGGPTALWTGLRPGLVLTVNPAITYGVFERLKTWILQSRPRASGKLSLGEAFVLGMCSKTLATVVTYPYIFVSTTDTRCSALMIRQRSGSRRKRMLLQPRVKAKGKATRRSRRSDPLRMPSWSISPSRKTSLQLNLGILRRPHRTRESAGVVAPFLCCARCTRRKGLLGGIKVSEHK